jgi:Protein of unknown function (DUF2516)
VTGEVFGLDGIFILLIAVVMLVIPIWALVDAISRPSGAFSAAGSSKGMWVALIAITWLLTGIIGTVLSIVYLASIRPRVRAVMP